MACGQSGYGVFSKGNTFVSAYRGKRNESAYVRYVCEKVAEIKGVSADEVARITSANARRMFLRSE